MGETHHHLCGLSCRVDRRIDPGGAAHLPGAPVAKNRDREAGAMHPREHGGLEAVSIIAQREHRGGGAAAALATQEIAVKRGSVEHARPIECVGELSGPLGVALDQAHANASIKQNASDRRAQARRTE